MNNDGYEIISDYLKLVRWYLPEEIAEEIITELRCYIIEEAEELSKSGLSLEAAKRTTARLGVPSEVAKEYLEFISPGKRIETPKKNLKLPKWLKGFIIGITLFAPFVISGPIMMSLTWIWDVTGYTSYGSSFLSPTALAMGNIYGFFNLIFGIQIIRYLEYKTPWWNVVTFGFLTFALPIVYFFSIIWMSTQVSIGANLVTPIPIQFVLGMILIYSRENRIAGWTAKEALIEIPIKPQETKTYAKISKFTVLVITMFTALVPFAVGYITDLAGNQTSMVWALSWTFTESGFSSIEGILIGYLVGGIIHILFGIQILFFIHGKANVKAVITTGVLSVLHPIFAGWYYSTYLASVETTVLIIPIPLQLILGTIVILASKIRTIKQ